MILGYQFKSQWGMSQYNDLFMFFFLSSVIE